MTYRAIAVLLTTALAGPILAQAPPVPVAQAVPAGAIASFTGCLASQKPAQAEAWLATLPGTVRETQAFDALLPVNDTACAGFVAAPGGLQFQIPALSLRGGLAQSLYLARYPAGAPPLIASATPETMPDEIYNARILTAADPQAELARAFGDCVVSARALDVDRLVRAEANSTAETVAIAAVQPLLGFCLWNGQSVSFSRESLRAALADALYRKAEGIVVLAAPPPTATPESGSE